MSERADLLMEAVHLYARASVECERGNSTLKYVDERRNALEKVIRELVEENEELRAAVRASAETFQVVGDDNYWSGEESCWFCDGEMANQSVRHKADCVWVECQPTATASNPLR